MFHVLAEFGPWWLTIWLVLVIGGLVALGAVAGPWVPGAITAIGALSVGGAAVVKRLGSGQTPPPPDPPQPDPAAELSA